MIFAFVPNHFKSRRKRVFKTRETQPMSGHSLLDLLLALLLRQTALGFFVQVIGQLLLVGPPLLLRRHLVLEINNRHD